jgi:thymidylate kinase
MGILHKYTTDTFFRFGYPSIETFLILSKRAFEAKNRLMPKLERGYSVICDRDIDTVCSYQLSTLLEENPNLNVNDVIQAIRCFNNLSIPSPSLTFYLRADMNVCAKRFKADPNRNGNLITADHEEFLESALEYYDACFENEINGRTLIRINANKPKKHVLKEVIEKFELWQKETLSAKRK